MRIVQISTVHPKSDSRIFGKQSKHLVKLGHEVYFIVRNNGNETIDGVNIVAIPSIKNRAFRLLFSWIPAFREAIRIKADFYQFHDPELIWLGFLLKAMGKKVVYDIHEDYELQASQKEYLPVWARKVIAFAYKEIEKVFLPKFDLIITATPTIRDKYQKIHKNVIDIKNYPDLEEFRPSREGFENKFSEICYVGGISENRGIVDYIKCIEKVDVKLNLAGAFMYQKTKEKVVSMPGWSKVRDYGYVNRQEVSAILRRSRIGLVVLHPSLNHVDSLPVKMFEYMAAGVPVICSNLPGFEKIILDHKCGFSTEPGDVKELEGKIMKLINNKELWEEMSNNAINSVEAKFNWQVEMKRLVKSYEETFSHLENLHPVLAK